MTFLSYNMTSILSPTTCFVASPNSVKSGNTALKAAEIFGCQNGQGKYTLFYVSLIKINTSIVTSYFSGNVLGWFFIAVVLTDGSV